MFRRHFLPGFVFLSIVIVGGYGTVFRACIDLLVECQVCEALTVADALQWDCDLFDNGSADSSCP